MKILGLGVSVSKDDRHIVDSFLERALQKSRTLGADIEKVYVNDFDIQSCKGDENCYYFKPCPISSDMYMNLAEKIEESEGIIICVPTYATLLPDKLINFLQRVVSRKSLEDGCEAYIDTLPQTKGYIFQNKKIGLIVFGQMIGAESAAASLYTYLNLFRSTIVASSVISVKTYKEADVQNYSLEIADGIGERVVSGTIAGDQTYSYFIKNNTNKKLKLSEYYYESISENKKYRLSDIDSHKLVVLCTLFSLGDAIRVSNILKNIFNNINVIPIISLPPVPPFLNRDQILSKIKSRLKGLYLNVEYDLKLFNLLGLKYTNNIASVLVLNSNNQIVQEYYNRLGSSNIGEIKKYIDSCKTF